MSSHDAGDLVAVDITLDENESACCTQPVVEWHRGEHDRLAPTEPRLCGGELYVSWGFMVPAYLGEVVRPEEVHLAAVSSHWQVECVNGHVLFSSANGWTAADDAEQFDPSVIRWRVQNDGTPR